IRNQEVGGSTPLSGIVKSIAYVLFVFVIYFWVHFGVHLLLPTRLWVHGSSPNPCHFTHLSLAHPYSTFNLFCDW
ncbi:hypothetical protein, partial [Legionella norrlandica]|uniref:hypothetical protein n=2 Tax=Legionella TaxID=445 RepID=UPI0019D38255